MAGFSPIAAEYAGKNAILRPGVIHVHDVASAGWQGVERGRVRADFANIEAVLEIEV